MKQSKSKGPIFFAVGGTGGHLYPAQVLYEKLVAKGFQNPVWFLGKNLKKNPYLLQKFKEDERGLQIKEILSGSFSKNPLKSLATLGKLALGFFQAAYWILKKRPQSVVGFGSFYSAPTLLAAAIFRLPIFLYESDLKSGITNRLFTPFAKKIGACFIPKSDKSKAVKSEKEKDRAKTQKKVQVEPLIRMQIASDLQREKSREKSYAYFGLDPKKKTLLVFGGSQGAAFINGAIPEVFQNMKAWTKTWQVLHLSGKSEEPTLLQKKYEKAGFLVCVKPFEEKMSLALSLADCAVCRSGSSTILELMAHEVPALFIPYPYAYDHQAANALFMVAIRAGLCLRQPVATPKALEKHLKELMGDNTKLGEMRGAMKEYKKAQKAAPFEALVMGSAEAKN